MWIITDIKSSLTHYGKYYLCVPLFMFVLLFVINNAYTGNNQQFGLLANAFSEGKLHFLAPPYDLRDTVYHQGKYYWPLGPFPAVLLLPFVWTLHLFGIQFYEAYLHFFIFLTTFLVFYKIGLTLQYRKNDALLWAIAFCFASPLLGIALNPFSWHFAHNITVLLMAVCILLYLNKRSYWLIGILLGLLLTTRLTTVLFCVFFLLDLIFSSPKKYLVSKLYALLIPIIVCGVLLGSYNFARFGNFFEQGYNLQTLLNPSLRQARSYGISGLIHLPGNLYYAILSTPRPLFNDGVSQILKPPFYKPDGWGMSLIVTSPYFLYLCLLPYRGRTSKLLWLTICLIAAPILFYYGVGYLQYGYRYALDFLPLIMWLLMRNYRQHFGDLSTRLRVLILIAVLCNIYLTVSQTSPTISYVPY